MGGWEQPNKNNTGNISKTTNFDVRYMVYSIVEGVSRSTAARATQFKSIWLYLVVFLGLLGSFWSQIGLLP